MGEEIRLQEGLGEPCGGGREGGEEGQVHHPWSGDGEDPLEARNQGWQERYLRQACDGEGKASEDNRKGLPHGCSEEGGLSHWRFRVGILREAAAVKGSCISHGACA